LWLGGLAGLAIILLNIVDTNRSLPYGVNFADPDMRNLGNVCHARNRIPCS
jgi:hypothetical protein